MDEQTIADTIDSLALPFEQKAVGIRRIGLEAEGQAELCDKAALALCERAARIRTSIAKRNDYIIRNMLAADIKSIPDPLTPITLRANPPAVVIEDPARIPEQFKRTPDFTPPAPTPDKSAIKKAIEAAVAHASQLHANSPPDVLAQALAEARNAVPGACLIKGYRLA